MTEFISAHPLEILVGWYIFSALVSTMPEPRPDSFGYLWAYRALNTLAGNLKELVNFNVVPGSSVMRSKTEVVTSSISQTPQETK